LPGATEKQKSRKNRCPRKEHPVWILLLRANLFFGRWNFGSSFGKTKFSSFSNTPEKGRCSLGAPLSRAALLPEGHFVPAWPG